MFFDPEKIPVPLPVSSHSASQVKVFELCERKWTLENLHKLRGPASSSLELGSALHKQIEDWLTHGIEPKSPLAYAGIQNLPLRGSGFMAVEKSIEGTLMTGNLPWKGFIDLVYQKPNVLNVVQLWDHKSTKNMQWAKTNEQLKTDTQMNVYAKYAFTAEPKLERVELFHNNLVTSTMNYTEVRSNHVTRAENAEVWSEINSRAQEMQVLSDMAVQSADVNFWERATPNYDSCSAFGGCAFRDLCDKKRSPDASTGALYDFDAKPKTPGVQKMALSDLLKAKTTAVETQLAAQPPAAPVVRSALAEALRKDIIAQSRGPAGATATGPVSVLPPDAPAQGPGIAPPPSHMPDDDLTADAAPEAPETTGEVKKGRGRPKKGETAPATAQAAQAVGTLTPPAVSLAPTGFTLCIGCAPMGSGHTAVALEIVIANLQEKIAQQANVANIHVFDYSKKASLVTEALKSYEFTAPVYTFTTADGFLESIISAVLSPKAALVIRGTR